jgi:hypothetical protein
VRIRAEVVDETPMRPPKRVLWLDVTLENPSEDPCWALLPDRAAPAATQPLSRIERYELPATVLALRGVDAGAFALLVAAGATVTLRRLPLSVWDRAPDTLQLEALTASGLTIDGDAAGAPAAQGEIDAAPLENQRAVVRTSGGLGQPPVAVELDGPAPLRFTAASSRRSSPQ